MKQFMFITAAIVLTVTGLSSCSEDQQADQSTAIDAKTDNFKIVHTAEFSNFRNAFVTVIKKRSVAVKDNDVSLINDGNQHLLIDEAKALLVATGHKNDISGDNIAVIERALEVYTEKTQPTAKQ